MAEFKMPKYMYKGKQISLDECYRELSKMTYQPPVEIIHQGVETKLEGDIYEAIINYGISVDKDELVKALKYDRNQYEKGFIDGCNHDTDTITREVAREIFEEIERLCDARLYWNNCAIIQRDDIAELKKKYTE